MASIYIDRAEDGRISVRVMTGIVGDRITMFANRAEAERFAESKMGRRGMIQSTLDMTPEQLAAHRAREARTAALMAKILEGKST